MTYIGQHCWLNNVDSAGTKLDQLDLEKPDDILALFSIVISNYTSAYIRWKIRLFTLKRCRHVTAVHHLSSQFYHPYLAPNMNSMFNVSANIIRCMLVVLANSKHHLSSQFYHHLVPHMNSMFNVSANIIRCKLATLSQRQKPMLPGRRKYWLGLTTW